MAKSFDFRKIKKRYFTVTLPNETTVMICTPTKNIMDEFISLKDKLDPENIESEEVIGELYELSAKIMSRNKGGIQITAKELEEMLDFEDIIYFIQGYTDFINEMTSSKN